MAYKGKYQGQYGPEWNPFTNAAAGNGGEVMGPIQSTGGLSNLGSLGGGGFTSGYQTGGPGDSFSLPSGGGAWDAIKGIGGFIWDKGGDFLNLIGGEGGTAGGLKNIGLSLLMLQQMKQANDDRKADQEFRQGLLDVGSNNLEKAEGLFDAKAPLRAQGMQALLGALGNAPTGAADFLKRSEEGKSTPGQYVSK